MAVFIVYVTEPIWTVSPSTKLPVEVKVCDAFVPEPTAQPTLLASSPTLNGPIVVAERKPLMA